MNNYVGKTCPYCKTQLKETDDIVICSNCAMPHHKECWIENQGCTTFGCTGTIESINQDSNTEINITQTADNIQSNITINTLQNNISDSETYQNIYCSRCGFLTSSKYSFCSRCGAKLLNPSASNYANNPGISIATAIPVTKNTSINNNIYIGEGYKKHYLNIKDEDIPIYETLIKYNHKYYISIFDKLKQSGSQTSWNWAAFIFSGYWCIYRKMYSIGALIFIVFTFLSILNIFPAFMWLVMAGLVGVFANNLYMNCIDEDVQIIKRASDIEREYLLNKKAGNNEIAVIVTVLITFFIIIFLRVFINGVY